MYIIDLHCDALMKLQEGRGVLRFADAKELDTNKKRLQAGQVKVQCFAIFIEPDIKGDQKFQVALEQIDYFYKEVLGKIRIWFISKSGLILTGCNRDKLERC